MNDSRLRRGSVVELPGGRVGTLRRLDRSKKKPGRWWKVATLQTKHPLERLESHPEKDLIFIYQEGGY